MPNIALVPRVDDGLGHPASLGDHQARIVDPSRDLRRCGSGLTLESQPARQVDA